MEPALLKRRISPVATPDQNRPTFRLMFVPAHAGTTAPTRKSGRAAGGFGIAAGSLAMHSRGGDEFPDVGRTAFRAIRPGIADLVHRGKRVVAGLALIIVGRHGGLPSR